MNNKCLFLSCVLLVASFLLTAKTSRADAFTVALNTTPLVGHSSAPFSLAFQFTNGDGTANNTVTISNFSFEGGMPMGVPALLGGASGNLSGSVTLTDSSFLNEFVQEFTPGNTLQFVVNLTTNTTGLTPDQFSFAILDSSGFEIPTEGPGDVLLSVDIASALRVQTFRSDPMRTSINIDPPQVIPEPATLLLLGTGLAGVAASVRRRRKAGK